MLIEIGGGGSWGLKHINAVFWRCNIMVSVSHNFGLSADYVFTPFHAVCLLRNPLRGAGTSDFILLDLNSWLGYTVSPTQNPLNWD
jgi:hypothetical protein